MKTKEFTKLISDDPLDGIHEGNSQRTVLPRGPRKGSVVERGKQTWFRTEKGVLIGMDYINKNPRIRLE